MMTGPELILSSLGSGSNGNAFLLEMGDTRVLLDAGIPIRTLLRCLKSRGLTPADLDAVLLSHEHSDHIQALPGLMRRARFPLLATRGTIGGLASNLAARAESIRPMKRLEIDGLSVTPFPVNHDSREPVGFFVQGADTNVTVMTDLGEVDEINAEFAARADHLVIESNYDVKMLRIGPYPAYLKQRIRSSTGHLSNDACAALLVDIVSTRTGGIWLSHLSENNNRPDLAVETASELLATKGHAREITALPRYDGNLVTWRSTQARTFVHQSSLPF